MDGEWVACDAATMSSPGADADRDGFDSAPGSRNQFADWVHPHLVAMHRLAARLAPACDPDDVIQDALHRAWRRRATYVADRGSLRSWLLAIVADQARKAQVRALRYRLFTSRSRPAQPVQTSARDLDLERAIAHLAPRQRQVINLHYFVDLTVKEIAEILDVSEGTVKSTLFDARSRLRELMTTSEEDRDA